MTQQPKETCQRTCRGPMYLVTILNALFEIQNVTWIKRSNPISKGEGVHFYYNSEQFISFSSFQKDTTCELQNCFQYREGFFDN